MNSNWRDERNKAHLNLNKIKLLIYFNLNIECKETVQMFSSDNYLFKVPKRNEKYVVKRNNKVLDLEKRNSTCEGDVSWGKRH